MCMDTSSSERGRKNEALLRENGSTVQSWSCGVLKGRKKIAAICRHSAQGLATMHCREALSVRNKIKKSNHTSALALLCIAMKNEVHVTSRRGVRVRKVFAYTHTHTRASRLSPFTTKRPSSIFEVQRKKKGPVEHRDKQEAAQSTSEQRLQVHAATGMCTADLPQ